MTFLARSELVRRLRVGDLCVSPILDANQIGASSIDLRLGNVVLMARARQLSHVDAEEMRRAASKTGYIEHLNHQKKHERHELPFREKFLLHPGALVLAPTLEWVSLPADLVGFVTARSTWAREGLNIATATLIEPGYDGIATLELTNLGQIPIALYPGLRVAQIAFAAAQGDSKRPGAQQFKMSFEPRQGNIIDGDQQFIP